MRAKILVDGDVVVRQHGGLGRITLNRPHAINALTLEMIRSIARALDTFEVSNVNSVLIDGTGPRGLCAGADLRMLYGAMVHDDPSPVQFFREEYRLNARLARFPKPIVSFMDGIVHGGGIGISAYAPIRIVTERSKLAMPEVAIGCSPDVGSTWLFSRMPNEWGTHIALTATRLGPADAIACGLGNFFANSELAEQLVADLSAGATPSEISTLLSDTAPAPPSLIRQSQWIKDCYASDSAEEIVDRLTNCEAGDAQRAAVEITAMSPTAINVTLRAFREARRLDSLEDCLNLEFGISSAYLRTHDFIEGIRAQIIDKDRTPRWEPARLDQVSDAVKRFFVKTNEQLPFEQNR